MKQYEVNKELRAKLIKESHKKHPKWKKRRGIRVILGCIWIIASILIGYILYDSNGRENMYMVLVGGIAGAIIFSIPYGIYYLALRSTCRNYIDYKNNEQLILAEDEIKNIYLPADAKRNFMYEEDSFKYTKIQKLIYNEYYNVLYIYGSYKKKWYKNYFQGKVGAERGIKDKNSKLMLYLYYYDNEEIIKSISQKSGVRLEVVNSI